ncbi:MAG: hypothetical protein ACLUR5_06520 [Eubacterium ventriosum]
MFLLSINDGIKADPTEGLANQLIGSFKKWSGICVSFRNDTATISHL